MTELRAITVCYEFADRLAITLPVMRPLFSEFLVVTNHSDHQTHDVAAQYEADTHNSEAFHAHGALFNKFAALEEALDHFGRFGWITILDADILWPTSPPLHNLEPGFLYGPSRHILDPITLPLPANWSTLPIQKNSTREFPGYSQIFHAQDHHLGPPPWHDTSFKHAGRADSLFQSKWPPENRIRLPWNALHLGQNGQDWAGRTSPFLDGSQHPQAKSRSDKLRQLKSSPNRNPNRRWDSERIN
jgi:hypothetical protein